MFQAEWEKPPQHSQLLTFVCSGRWGGLMNGREPLCYRANHTAPAQAPRPGLFQRYLSAAAPPAHQRRLPVVQERPLEQGRTSSRAPARREQAQHQALLSRLCWGGGGRGQCHVRRPQSPGTDCAAGPRVPEGPGRRPRASSREAAGAGLAVEWLLSRTPLLPRTSTGTPWLEAWQPGLESTSPPCGPQNLAQAGLFDPPPGWGCVLSADFPGDCL